MLEITKNVVQKLLQNLVWFFFILFYFLIWNLQKLG